MSEFRVDLFKFTDFLVSFFPHMHCTIVIYTPHIRYNNEIYQNYAIYINRAGQTHKKLLQNKVE